jgi:hypothetical protein
MPADLASFSDAEVQTLSDTVLPEHWVMPTAENYAEDYINKAHWDIAAARKESSNFTWLSRALWVVARLVFVIAVVSLFTGFIAAYPQSAGRIEAVRTAWNWMVTEHAILLTILLKVSPAPRIPPAFFLWVVCWFCWILGIVKLRHKAHKEASRLRENADDAEKDLPFQTALLRTLSGRTGDISADVVQIYNSTHMIWQQGEGKSPWWLGAVVPFVLGLLASVIANLLTPKLISP